MASTIFAGVLSAHFAGPVEVIMIQQQRFGGSMPGTVRRVVSDFGLGSRGLFRGLSMTMIREAVFTAGMLGVTPLTQEYLQESHGLSQLEAGMAASVVGGVFAALPSQPADVVKTCMQGDLERKTYTSARSTFKTVVKRVRDFLAHCVLFCIPFVDDATTNHARFASCRGRLCFTVGDDRHRLVLAPSTSTAFVGSGEEVAGGLLTLSVPYLLRTSAASVCHRSCLA